MSTRRPPKSPALGSSFDDFLREEGTYEETQATAIKRVIAYALVQAMEAQNISKAAMAKKMSTSRSQLDRLLDPMSTDIKLETLVRAAKATGRELRIELRP